MTAPARKFVKDFRKTLILPKAERNQFTASLSSILSDYLNDHPEAGYPDMVNTFGTPAKLAYQYIDSNHLNDMSRRYRRRRLMWIVIFTFLFVVLLSVGIWAFLSFVHLFPIEITKTITVG